MNETEPTDSKATPTESNEPTAPAEANASTVEATAAEAKVEPKAAEANPETEPGDKPALDAAKEKARETAEAVKAHDFKGDARKAATGVKRLWNDLRRHDYKSEIRETFAKAKKDPSSLWKKPETPRPGKDLAIAGLAVAVAGLFLLLVTSGAFIGVICLVLGLVALLAGVLGFATDGRSLAFAGAGAGVLAVLMSIAQIHAATRKPDPRDEIIRLLSAQLAQANEQSVSQKDVADLLARLEAAKSGKSEQSAEDLADAVSKLQSLTSSLDGGAAEAVASGLGQLLAGGSVPGGGNAAGVVASGLGQLLAGGSRPTGGGGDSFEATRARVAADPSLTVRPINLPGLAPRSPTGELLSQATDTPTEPPAGPSSARNKEVQQVLKKANIETMTVDLPNKVGLLLTKLPDGSFMGTFEVTQDQWLSVMGGENPSAEDNEGDDHPVDSIWPSDCLAFVEKLNNLPNVKQIGLQFRIPSEEEWEKACLAGAKRKRDFGLRLDGVRVESGREGNVGEIAWRKDMFSPSATRRGTSHSVGRKQPNAFGLYDMHGNVAELTFARDPKSSRFASKGGYWDVGDGLCEAWKTGEHVYEEPVKNPRQAEEVFNYSLGIRVAASILDADIRRIFGAAEKLAENGEAAFFGFYPGMSEEDATRLAKHFGFATDGDLAKDAGNQVTRNSRSVAMETPHCRFKVDPATKTVSQIRFDLPAILALTKKSYTKGKFDEFCDEMSQFIGTLECVQDGKNAHGSVVKAIVYQRKTSKGTIISLEQEPKSNDPAVLLTLETLDKDFVRLLAAGEEAAENGGVAFFGFYPGMPEADATKLAGHYGLKVGDNLGFSIDRTESIIDDSAFQEEQKTGLCRFVTDPLSKKVIQMHLNLSAIQSLTKESYSEYDRDKFCNSIAKFTGNLECVQAAKKFGELFLYQRKASNGTAVFFGETVVKTRSSGGAISKSKEIRLTLEDSAAMASLTAAKMASANNARIEAVEPVLNNAGIKTKTIELPGGVKLLLTLLPNERYLGTFEVTQAQFFSLMGTNVSQCVGADLPVDSVSVRDCLDFIAKANELPAVKEENLRFRLPSLADWEEACRAGTEGDYTKRLDGTEVDKNSISVMTKPSDAGKTAEHGPHPVGVAMPNAFGLYDMFGNVSEWVSDKVMDNPHHADSHYHMGGSWSRTEIKPIVADVQHRNYYEFDDPSKPRSAASLGFRVSVVSWPREIQRAKDEAAKAYALSNNGRIDAVKPVLEKAGIETKEIELPGGVRMLLNKTPAGAWAAAFEVTQAQWKSLLHDNPSSFTGDPLCTDDIVLEIWRSWKDDNPEKLRGTGLPVDQVSPGDVQLFLVLLNALPSVNGAGISFHLPTEDEWLYIARAGAKSKYAQPLEGGESSVNLMGWHKDNVVSDKRAPKHLQVVGQKQPNAFGLYDVHGNVAEFAESRYGGRDKSGIYSKGGSIGGMSSIHSGQEDCILDKQIAGYGDKESWMAAFGAAKAPVAAFNGFRLVATETSRHFVDPEMVAASNARIDAVKPLLDARGIETKVLELPCGVKLLLNKLPGGLWAGAFEVTQAQFLSLLGENPSVVIDFLSKEVHERPWQYRTGDRPVDTVTKAGADAFLSALNALPCAKEAGLSFGLPDCGTWAKFCGVKLNELTAEKMTHDSGVRISEAEFEASKKLRGWDRSFSGISLPAGKELKDMGWFHEDGAESSHPVGEKEPNQFGLFDIFGNVSEWTGTRDETVEARRKREGPLGGDTVVNGKVMADSQFYVTGGSHHRLYNTYPFFSQYSSALGNLAATGFRVWAAPAKAAGPAPENPAVNSFAQDSNARIDAVKPVLDEAGIETKEIELPGGARILMNKLPNGAWMAAFETTQAQFVSVFGRNPSRKISKGGDRAVENVSWNAATVYVSVLNRLPSVKESGLHFRLPSSTEWEYACRGGGGLAPQGKPLEKGKGKLDDMGWYDKNSDIEGVVQTHRVGQLQPNAFGLYDMIGNVAEWTATAYSQRALGDHTIGSRRIWRGGSWISPKERCTAAWRGLLPSDAARPDTGFRLYATEDGSDPKDENVVFRDKEYKDAIKPGPLPDDRTAEQKLIGALLDLQIEMQKAEIRLQVEEARFELELMGIDPDTLF